MSEGATDIFDKIRGEGYYYSLIWRYLMDFETKFREFSIVSRGIFQS